MTKQPLVLVVDDTEEIRVVFRLLIEAELGWKCTLASDGLFALEYLKMYYDRVDLILLDLMMPGMSGIAFMQELHRLHDTGSIKKLPQIIAVSACDEGKLRQARQRGIQYVIRKPFDVEDAIKEMERAMAS